MNEQQPETAKKQRFFRDGAPYFHDFEMVVSKMFENDSHNSQLLFSSMLELFKNLNLHLADCQSLLGKVELMVESAREKKADPAEIEKLISVCRDLQSLQLNLADYVKQCVNRIIDKLFLNRV